LLPALKKLHIPVSVMNFLSHSYGTEEEEDTGKSTWVPNEKGEGNL
jgi:hypothetical protein